MKNYVKISFISFVLMAAVLAGCQPAVPSIPTNPIPTATVQEEPAPTPTAEATATTEPVTAEPEPAETIPAEPGSTETPADTAGPGVDPFQRARQIIEGLSTPIPAPEGWTVEVCEGMAPALCVMRDGQFIGSFELYVYPMESMTDFQAMLAAHGLDAADLDVQSEAYAQGAVPALRDFAQNHMQIVAEDRQITYGDQVTFEALEPEPISFGALPGLFYGFTTTDAQGEVMERNIIATTFDQDFVYTINAFYDPAVEWSLPSVEDLETFTPFWREIVASLPIDGPLPEEGATGGLQTVAHEGVSFTYDPMLARFVQPEAIPAQTVELVGYQHWYPAHVKFTFAGADAEHGNLPRLTIDQSIDPQLSMYPIGTAPEDAGTDRLAEIVPALQTLLAEQPADPAEIPILPFINAAQVFRSNVEYINFQGGTGVRFVTQYSQDARPITNQDLFYTFQGITDDGAYYVEMYFPVHTSLLPDEETVTDPDAFAQNYEAYLAETVASLDEADGTAFSPDLARLDAVIESLQINHVP